MDRDERQSKERLCIGVMMIFSLLLILGSIQRGGVGIEFKGAYIVAYVTGFLYYAMVSHRLFEGTKLKILGILVSYLFAASSAAIVMVFRDSLISLEPTGVLYISCYLLVYLVLVLALVPGLPFTPLREKEVRRNYG